jgi:hypothetical protein
MKKTTAPLSVAGSQLGEARHVCAFFNSDEEERISFLPELRECRAMRTSSSSTAA